MIDDLSRTLKAILTEQTAAAVAERQRLPAELASAHVVFDHPSEEFRPQQTTVDLFLYDIREDLELRSNEPLIERKNGVVITHQPPLRVSCSYLVTAWPVGGADSPLQEQRLLSQVLQVFARLPKIPDSFLQGSLRGQSPPLPMITALVDPQKNLSEFWTALGSQLRPSLTITVTFSMPVLEPEKATMVTKEDVILAQRTSPDQEDIIPSTAENIVRIGIRGRVTDSANTPVAGAVVTLVELGLSATTDGDGGYKLILRQPGRYKLRAQKGNTIKEASIEAQAGATNDLQLQ